MIDSLGRLVDRLHARERARLVRFRHPAELSAAIAALEAAATATESTATSRHAAAVADLHRRRRLLAQRLATLTERSAASPGSPRSRRDLQDARLALGAASILTADGSAEAAAAQLAVADRALARAAASLDHRDVRLRDDHLRRLWQRWIERTVADTPPGQPIVVVDKLHRRCVVLRDGAVVARYAAEFGRNGRAAKLYAGDGATPEGQYAIARKNAASRYHLSLALDYPNAADRERHRQATRAGRVPAGAGPGGAIAIHGHGGRDADWTDGCVALRDADIEKLFALVEVGTPVIIVGAASLPGD